MGLWGERGRVNLASLDVLAEDSDLPDAEVLYEHQPADAGDLPDLADDIASAVQEWLREGDLSWDDGWPALDEPAFANSIRGLVLDALSEHTDLSEAAWVRTGRTMTVGEARARLWPRDDDEPQPAGVKVE